MIYNFDFFIHDEHDTSEDLTDQKVDQFESISECDGSDPFGDFEHNENHTILFFVNNKLFQNTKFNFNKIF